MDASSGVHLFSGQKNRHKGGTKRNTVTLAFIAVSRSRRPVLIIKKIATITSVSGKNAFSCLAASASTVEPELGPLLDFPEKKPPSLAG